MIRQRICDELPGQAVEKIRLLNPAAAPCRGDRPTSFARRLNGQAMKLFRSARLAGAKSNERVETSADLDTLPNMSVVQFRGPGLGARNRLVWQLDEEWFSPGSTESVPSSYFPPEAFPAAVLCKPAP